MTLGGLWHGASWNFVLWGCFHGALLVIHRFFQRFIVSRDSLNSFLQSIPGTIYRAALTFAAVSAGWVLFRASSLAVAGTIFGRMVVPSDGKTSPLQGLSLWILHRCLGRGACVGRDGIVETALTAACLRPALGAAYAVALNLALVLAPDAGKTFIYFQF